MKQKIRLTEGDLHRIVKKCINETLKKDFWHGVNGSELIWHGEWSDPEVLYNGKEINGTDLEDNAWAFYKIDCEENGKKPNEQEFDNLPPSWFKEYLDNYYLANDEDYNLSEGKLHKIIRRCVNEELRRAKLQEVIWCDTHRCANDKGMMDELNQMYDEGNYKGMIDYLAQWDYGNENGGEMYDDLQEYDDVLEETDRYILVTVDPRHYWGDRPFGLYVKLTEDELE